MEKREVLQEQSGHPPEKEINDPAGELAWDYCQRSRNGENPSMAAYLQKLKKEERLEFQRLVALDTLVDAAATDFQSRIALNAQR